MASLVRVEVKTHLPNHLAFKRLLLDFKRAVNDYAILKRVQETTYFESKPDKIKRKRAESLERNRRALKLNTQHSEKEYGQASRQDLRP